MDLAPELPHGVQRILTRGGPVDQYETVEALERYCYLVASVVGLVTIRIFGYTNPAAELYAERLGLAFQLTNILRDVKEDAERGRVYLPLELLEKHGLRTEDVLAQARRSEVSPALQAALAELATRAQSLYRASGQLIPLLATDSRAAMRVLVRIYHLLLLRIVHVRYRVLDRRISVPTLRKVLVLVRGVVESFLHRALASIRTRS